MFKFGLDSPKEISAALKSHCSVIERSESDLENEFAKVEWALDNLPESVAQDCRRSCAEVYAARSRVPWRARAPPAGEVGTLAFLKGHLEQV